jgi:hypothetical protein
MSNPKNGAAFEEEEAKQEIEQDEEQPKEVLPLPVMMRPQDDRTNSSNDRMLPVVTEELMSEHLKEQEAKKQKNHSPNGGRNNDHGNSNNGQEHGNLDDEEPSECCGIPYYLFMTLVALGAAVLAGTVSAVIYYEPDSGVQPPSPTETETTLLPTPTPTTMNRTLIMMDMDMDLNPTTLP